MISAHSNVQQVIQAVCETSRRNGASTPVQDHRVLEMLQEARLDRRIAHLAQPVLRVLLDLVSRSGFWSVRHGFMPAMPRWISDSTIVVDGCGPKTLKKRVQRVAEAMNAGIARSGAQPMERVPILWDWLRPLEPYLAKMTDAEVESLLRFHSSGCGLISAKRRVEHLPADIRIQTNGRIVVPSGLPLP